MRNGVGEYRFLVDEASFSSSVSAAEEIEDAFDRLSDHVLLCRERGELVGIISDYDLVEAALGMPLHELLTSSTLSHDCRLRAYGLLDKCRRFDSEVSFAVDPSVEVDGFAVESFALATIAAAYRNGRAIGALALFPVGGPGEVDLVDSEGQCQAFIIGSDFNRCEFYRSIFAVENVQESDFFIWTSIAFPQLRFADGLTFRRFSGAYQDLRDSVVTHLAALNDRFMAAFVRHHGMSDDVAADVGVDLSIEGNARKSEHLMVLRDVTYRGKRYRCEWHSKLEPHRNRIHFCPGDDEIHGCVLIGIFVDHLLT